MKNLDEISQSFRKRACFRLIVSLKKSYKLKKFRLWCFAQQDILPFQADENLIDLNLRGMKIKVGQGIFPPLRSAEFYSGPAHSSQIRDYLTSAECFLYVHNKYRDEFVS